MTDRQNRNLNKLKSVQAAETELKSRYALKTADEKRTEQFRNNFPFRCCAEEYDKCAELSESMMRNISQRYNATYAHYAAVRKEAENAIDALPASQLRQILRWRYLEYKTMEEIADMLYYSLRTVKYKHMKALEMISFPDTAEK